MNAGKWLLDNSALRHHIVSAVIKIFQIGSVEHVCEQLLLALVVQVNAAGFEIGGLKATLRVIILPRLELFVLLLDDFVGCASSRVLVHLLVLLFFINEHHVVSIFVNGLLDGDQLFGVNRGHVSAVCNRSVVVRASVAFADVEARRQDIRQGELLLDLVHHFHVPHDLKGPAVDEAVICGCLSFGWSVGGLSGHASVDPEVDQIGAERGPENRSNNGSRHAVLI